MPRDDFSFRAFSAMTLGMCGYPGAMPQGYYMSRPWRLDARSKPFSLCERKQCSRDISVCCQRELAVTFIAHDVSAKPTLSTMNSYRPFLIIALMLLVAAAGT